MASDGANKEFTELYTAQTQLSNELAEENGLLLNRQRQSVPQRQAFVDQLLKKLDNLVKKHAENDARLRELNAGGEFDGRSYFQKRHAEAFGEIVANMRKKCNKILERIAGVGGGLGENVEALDDDEDSENPEEAKVEDTASAQQGDLIPNLDNFQTPTTVLPNPIPRFPLPRQPQVQPWQQPQVGYQGFTYGTQYQPMPFTQGGVTYMYPGMQQAGQFQGMPQQSQYGSQQAPDPRVEQLERMMQEMRNQMAHMVTNGTTNQGSPSLLQDTSNPGSSSNPELGQMLREMTQMNQRTTQMQLRTEFPTFPTDLVKYGEYKQQANNWVRNYGSFMSDSEKFDRLRVSVNKAGNPDAVAIVARFEINGTDNYVEAWKQLDEKFLVVRKLVETVLERLVDLPGASDRALKHVNNTLVGEFHNLEQIVKGVFPNLTEVERDAAMYAAVKSALALRALDSHTKILVTGRMRLKHDEVPKYEKIHEQIANILAVNENVQLKNDLGIPLKKTQQPQQPQKHTAKVSAVQQQAAQAPRAGGGAPAGARTLACFLCGANHTAVKCSKLLGLPADKRYDFVASKKVCCMCLRQPYVVGTPCKCAKDDKPCKVGDCARRHHKLLHVDTPAGHRAGAPRQNAKVATAKIVEMPEGNKVALIPTACVRVMGADGEMHNARVFLDSGASHTMTTYDFATRLGLKQKRVRVDLVDYSGQSSVSIKHAVNIAMKPRFKSPFTINVEALVTEKLEGNYPSVQVEVDLPEAFDRSLLADPEFGTPRECDMIVNTNAMRDLLFHELKPIKDYPMLVYTPLGYIVWGSGRAAKTIARLSAVQSTYIEKEEYAPISRGLDKFFEHVTVNEEQDDYTEKHFLEHVTLDKEGLKVRIPWLPSKTLGESKAQTVARIRGMMQRLTPENFLAYRKSFEDQLKAGIMVQAPANVPAKNYIGNFALKTNSLTTPLRVLFTCDQKTSNGRSVNDIQMTGRRLQQSLPECIVRFRQKEIAVTADIKKMFLNVWVHQDDAAYQRSFYAEQPDGPLIEVQLQTLIFGMRSSPFLAIRAKDYLADLPGNDMEVRNVIRRHFYVDDLITSFDSCEEAQDVLEKVQKVLAKGRFKLSKFAASKEGALKGIAPDLRLDDISKDLDKDETAEVKILGIMWNRQDDTLSYNVKLEPTKTPTRRSCVSIAARIYDPTGILAPAMMPAKLIIQKMWAADAATRKPRETEKSARRKQIKEEWDAPLPADLATAWLEWEAQLESLKKVRVPRWLQHRPSGRKMLIGFCDASLLGYGCCVYLRCLDDNNRTTVGLIGGKGKVTPLSKSFVSVTKEDRLTIPRLELMSAVLLAEMMKDNFNALDFPYDMEMAAYTDSRISLAWIQGDHARWNVFVFNRVEQITASVPKDKWFYVNTKKNPADEVSRGLLPDEFLKSELWLKGPQFIHDEPINHEHVEFNEEELLECRDVVARVAAFVPDVSLIEKLEKSDKWTKTIRVVAYVNRVVAKLHKNRAKVKSAKTTRKEAIRKRKWWALSKEERRARLEPLTSKECAVAESIIIRAYQPSAYSKEIACIYVGRPIKGGPLQTLAPFIDEQGVLRVGGRLSNATHMSYNARHKMILPKLVFPRNAEEDNILTTSLTRKIIVWAHICTLHGGEAKTRAFIEARYHIPNARRAIRYLIARCLPCCVQKAKTTLQQMGPLPKASITPALPFVHVTLDYAGPINIKYNSRRMRRATAEDKLQHVIKSKAWIMVLVCRVTGAYHIECVEDLTADSCVQAFKRFVASRGKPTTVRSDNASTFVAARKELINDEKQACELAIAAIKQGEKDIKRKYAIEGVDVESDCNEARLMLWSFNPPYSPDTGGKHEAAVKQVKLPLKKIMGQTLFTYPQLMTVLKQIEAAANSRPLCRAVGPAYDRDPVLTPAMILHGRSLIAMPETDYSDVRVNPTNVHIFMQKVVQDFWRLFRTQYTSTLQELSRWKGVLPNMEVGTIVLIKDDNTPSNVWRMGQVTEVCPGKDNMVRVVKLFVPQKDGEKTITTLTRSIRSLVKLPIVTQAVAAKEDAADSSRAGSAMPLPVGPPVEDWNDPGENSRFDKDGKEVTTAVVDDTPAAEPTNTAPLRRSARIALKNIVGIVLLCLMMMMKGIAGVTPINGTGLVFLKDRDVLIRTGTYHVQIDTDLIPHVQIETIKRYNKRYQRSCEEARDKWSDIFCKAQGQDIERLANGTVAKLQDYTKTRLTKRNAWFGKRLWDWFAGNDADDTLHDARSMGVVSHAISAFKTVERQLQVKEQLISNHMNELDALIEKENSRLATFVDKSAINIALIGLYNLIIQHVQQISTTYNNLKSMIMETNEFEQMIDTVQKNAQGAKVPAITFKEMEKLLSPQIKWSDKGAIIVQLDIPMVLPDRFTQVMAVPVPDPITEKIVNEPVQKILINQKLEEFLVPVKLTNINETLSITREVITSFNKLTSGHDCVARAALTGRQSCAVHQLPAIYDEWIETPLHNAYVFYSNQKKVQVCSESRTEIQEKTGFINIPEGCVIETPVRRIRASSDRTRAQGHAFHVPIEELEIATAATQVTSDATRRSVTAQLEVIDDSELDVVQIEANNALKPEIWWIIVCTAASVIILLVVTLACVAYRYLRYSPRHRREPEDTYDAISLRKMTSNTTLATNQTNTLAGGREHVRAH